MMRARIVSSRVGTGVPPTCYRPEVFVAYPPAANRQLADVDAQPKPTTPDLLIVEGVWDDAVFAALASDARFLVLHSDSKRQDSAMEETEHTGLRSYLQAAGITAAQARTIAGNTTLGRTRAQVVRMVVDRLKLAPARGAT